MSDPHAQAALEYLIQQSQGLLEGNQSRIWKHEPLPFRRFVPEHLKIQLTDRQMTNAIMLLGEDPKKTFEGGSPYTTFVLIAGKGSGKDLLAAVIMLFCFYLLLCMHDPREYFTFPMSEAIDMLIISYTEEQAREVTFDKFKQLLKHWVWLKQNFSVIEGEKYVTSHRNKPLIVILADRIRTWNNIKITAEHSMNEGFEGYNPLVWAMSEASAFSARTNARNGRKVYNTLRSSASTRFGNKWKGLAYSYLRDDEISDFTWQLYEEAAKTTTMWRDLCLPWEFKPPRFFSTATFDFPVDVEVKNEDGTTFVEHRVYKVPVVPYQDEVLSSTDLEFFKKSTLCLISRVGEKAASMETITSAIHPFGPLITFTNKIEPDVEGRPTILLELPDLTDRSRFVWDYLITVDLGEKHAATGVAVSHKEPGKGFVLDALLSWTPIEKDAQNPIAAHVNMEDVRVKLVTLAKALNNARVGFDQWQSILYAAQMSAEGLAVETYHVHQARDYRIFGQAMGARMAWIVNDPEILRQWNALVMDGNEVKLDKRISRRKDLVDATLGGFKILMKDYQIAPMGVPGATVIRANLGDQGGVMVPDSFSS